MTTPEIPRYFVQRSDGSSVELLAPPLQTTPKRNWKAIAKAKAQASFAEPVDTVRRGKKFGSITNWTNATAWFDSVSTPAVATYSGRSYFLKGQTTMQIELRDYQLVAVNKAEGVGSFGCFDEMGTGKTVIGTAIDAVRRIQYLPALTGKTLIICPLGSVMDSWVRHFRWMQPDLKVIKLDNKARGVSWREFVATDADVLVVHWDAVQLMMKPGQDFLKDVTWMHIIADEVHKVKNRNAKVTKALKKIPCIYKTGLTGTPVDDKPQDLWSILNWLYPQEWRSFWKFIEAYTEKPDEDDTWPKRPYRQIGAPCNLVDLHRRIEPYTIRRKTQEAMPWLKDKNYIQYWIEMHPKQLEAYHQMKEDMVAWVHDEEAKGDMTPIVANAAIARLTRLQQFACAYARVDEEGKVQLMEPSSKLDRVCDLMMERLEQGEPVVIYSAFRQLIELLAARLDNMGIRYVTYTGKTPKPDRDANVQAFQSGQVNVFLGTIKAGGEGIDLFRSKCLIMLAREWNPSKNLQVEGRLWRSGQEGIVDVIDVYVENTVEVDKKETIELKWDWIRKMIGDTK